MPRVSILMPVFNRETLVGDSIRSIQNQTFSDWELIVLDDASTDRTLEVCRAFEAQDKRIHVFSNQQNLGVGKTRNRLISYATGEYIAHQDSDDESLSERLAIEVELLEAKPQVGLVCGVAALLDDEGHVFSHLPDNFDLYGGKQYPQDRSEMVRLLYLANRVPNPTCMFRRSLIEKTATPYGAYRVYEDWLLFIHVAHRALIWGIPKVLVKMRRGRRHVHLYNFDENLLREVCQIKRALYERYREDPQSPINYWLYRKSMAITLKKLGAHLGGFKGYLEILHAVLYDPFDRHTWKFLWQFSGRALRKSKRLAFR